MSDLDLMRLRADTDFVYDTGGRMIEVNDPDRSRPPHLFLGRTSAGCVARFGARISDALASQLTTIIDSEPPAFDLDSSPATLHMIRGTLAKEVPVSVEGGGPAYRFPSAISRPRDVIQLTSSNLDLVRDTYSWLRDELPEWAPCFAIVRDGHAVSVCFSSRIGHEAAEAGLDTRPDFRGRGFAVAVTAAWGAAIVESGRVPIYSTSYDNLASQGVARRVGLIRFGVDITFS